MPPENTTPLILVDGSSYLYRAFYGLPPLSTSQGQPTGAIYGVVNMLHKLMAEYQPHAMAVVFDAKGPTFRNTLYPEYKATRKKAPDELAAQISALHEVVRALGLPLFEVPGVEADDVLGTLACAAARAGWPVLISTSDKDLTQLVSKHITVVNTMDNTRLDARGVEQKFGVSPAKIPDYLTLIGDKVDNVPGVPGVGPKTAVKWLQTYGSLAEVLAHAEEIVGRVGENLRLVKDRLPLSLKLVQIKCDAIPADLEALHVQPPDVDRLRALYQALEFKGWLRELDTPRISTPEQPATSEQNAHVTPPALRKTTAYEIILSPSQLAQWLERIATAALVALDTETTGLDYMQAQLVGLSLAVEPDVAAYLPLAHDYPDAPQQLDLTEVLTHLKPWLEDPTRPKLGHHLKFDAHILTRYGITLRGIAHDTMLESYVLDSTASRHDLDTLCERHLDHQTIRFEDVAGKGAGQRRFNQVPIDQAAAYAAEDADMALCLHRHFWPKLEAKPRLKTLYETIEIPLVPVLLRMERNGVRVDADQLKAQSELLAGRIRAVEQATFALAGAEFNLSSPRQIQEILFEQLKLPVMRKTPTGQPSTAEDVLEALALEYPLPRLILEHRTLAKLKSTYTDKLPTQINPATGRIHTSYHQAVTSTGRLSSSDPNLQNIPIRTEEGRRIRRAFVASPGYVLLAADYSQIELRIMAHLSGDEGLLKAFAQGTDIHRVTAAWVFGIAPEAVTDEMRRTAKAINFGLIYGMSAYGLARQLGIDRLTAARYVERYFTHYPGVRRYMDEARRLAREQGFVETVFGRRLYVSDIHARNANRRQYAERTAINAPMQGTAADLIKHAMIAVDHWLQETGIDARLVLQVHDELVLEIKETEMEAVREAVVQHMTGAATLAVPLMVETGAGYNWDEAH